MIIQTWQKIQKALIIAKVLCITTDSFNFSMYLKKNPHFFGLQSENYTTKWLSTYCQIGLHLQFAFQFAKNWWFLSRNFKCICFPACMHTTYKQQQNFIQFATFLGGIICTLQLHFLDNSSKILNFWMNGVNFKVTVIETF